MNSGPYVLKEFIRWALPKASWIAASNAAAVTSVHNLGMGSARCNRSDTSAAALRYSGARSQLISIGWANFWWLPVTFASSAASAFIASFLVSFVIFFDGKEKV